MIETDDIIHTLGRIIFRSARDSETDWDYAGYAFSIDEDENTQVSPFLFTNGNRGSLEYLSTRHMVTSAFLRLREVTRVPNDDMWKAMLMVLRKDGGKLKFLFEFDDADRWAITPGNADESFRSLVGEVFPEAISDN